jgi:GTPase SAR1 family protein
MLHPTNFDRAIGILVMGLTGAGKSTFISQLTQQDVDIGHSLDSCMSPLDLRKTYLNHFQARPMRWATTSLTTVGRYT